MFSNDHHWKNKSKHLQKIFWDINGYPNCVAEQTIEKLKNRNEMAQSTQVTTNTEENEHLLMLSYKGKVRQATLNSLQNFFNLSCQQVTRAKSSTLERN